MPRRTTNTPGQRKAPVSPLIAELGTLTPDTLDLTGGGRSAQAGQRTDRGRRL